MTQIVQCKQCGNRSTSSSPFKDITVPVVTSVQYGIGLCLATEKLDAEQKYNCLECQTLTNAKIKKKFLKMPQHLVVHINRFEDTGDQEYHKIKKPIGYPLQLDFDALCNHPVDQLGRFKLQSLILHKGKSLESGHYWAITQRPDGRWWICNDNQIECLSFDTEFVLQHQKQVYLLVYRKEEVGATMNPQSFLQRMSQAPPSTVKDVS